MMDKAYQILKRPLISEKSTSRTLGGREELVSAVGGLFGMPKEIVAEVVGELAELRDVWG